MRKTGATYTEIKRAFGLKEAKVASILRKHGMTNNEEVNKAIEKRKQQENIAKTNIKEAEQKAKEDNRRKLEEMEKIEQEKLEKAVVEMRKTGATYRQIKRAFGLKEAKVASILSKLGMINNKEVDVVMEQKKVEKKRIRDKKIIEMAQEGARAEEIADENNIAVGTVYKILKANNTNIKAKRRKKTKTKEEETRDKKIIEMAQEGARAKEIAEGNNISIVSVYKILKANNTTIKAKRRKEQKKKNPFIKQIYDTKARVNTKELINFIEMNYQTINREELLLIVKIFITQGELNQAIKLINSLKTIKDDMSISEEEIGALGKVLKEYKNKMIVRRSLEEGKTVSQISEQMRLPTIEVIRIKKEWEQIKSNSKDNKNNDDILQGWDFGED